MGEFTFGTLHRQEANDEWSEGNEDGLVEIAPVYTGVVTPGRRVEPAAIMPLVTCPKARRPYVVSTSPVLATR